MSTDKSFGEITLRLERALLDGIDAYSATENGITSRDEAVRRIVHDWLRAKGYLRISEREQGTRPQDLTSENDD
ncbi:hypothetical protein [Oricola thermophila]|uniref:CopG family transcriptional regulator n=1 Tax=Oricola thermophila TaxID=2742145 RepID=A0A6N1VH74_9HYPH|nr:hypothetical protein [Oricola thermophila]QKV20138.1 hypothetical protein HTY61_17640 [Oricola thermophila]